MAKEPMMIDREWRKADAAIRIIDCVGKAVDLQKEYFKLITSLSEGGYKRATDTIRNLISDIKNHTLILQALLLEFDDGIPVAEDGVAKALNDLRDAMKDVEE
jgi:hypothetical protein